MKQYLNDRDLNSLGIDGRALSQLAEVGALPPLHDVGGQKRIKTAELGALFNHLAGSFYALRKRAEAMDAAQEAYAGAIQEVTDGTAP